MGSGEAALLGLVQGITEFLPVSSSGHLRLGQSLLGIARAPLFFDIVLHVGTLLAVLWVLRGPVLRLLGGVREGALELLRRGPAAAVANPELRLALLILAATVPTGLIGVLLGDQLDALVSSPGRVGVVLMMNGIILYATRWAPQTEAVRIHHPFLQPVEWQEDSGDFLAARCAPDARRQGASDAVVLVGTSRSERRRRRRRWRADGGSGAGPRGPGLGTALLVGLAQGLAVTRGISRSGSTIATALFLGVNRREAATFSFLLSIPAILGALLLKLDLEALSQAGGGPSPWAYLIGLLVSALVGVLCLELLLGVVQRGKLHHFAYYCWVVGLSGLLWEIA